VESLISLRAALRADGHYDPADAVRTALAAADIELRDQPDTTVWQLRNSDRGRRT
jgi:cysteinyl-tRNA synthetase